MDNTRTDEAARTLVHYVARELVAERAHAGLSLRSAAEKSGLGVSTIQRFELEQRVPNLEQLSILCATYGTTVLDLLRRAEDRMGPDQNLFVTRSLELGD